MKQLTFRALDRLECNYDQKSLPFYSSDFEGVFANADLPCKILSFDFYLFTLRFHDPPLLMFKTDRFDFRAGLDLGKITSCAHYLKILAC